MKRFNTLLLIALFAFARPALANNFFLQYNRDTTAAQNKAGGIADFSVAKTSAGVQLVWQMEKSATPYLFRVERSNNGSEWKTVAYVFAAENIRTYTVKDHSKGARKAYFRIREVAADGISYCSEVRTKSVK